MKVAVLGSGAGALAVAADMSRHGRRTVMAELDGERARLEPVRAAGNITTTDTAAPGDGASDADTHAASAYPVDVADSVAEALAGAEFVAVVAPPDTPKRWARAVAPHTTPDHTVLFLGEGGGAIVARRVIEPPTVVAETNTLPHRARATGPATVDVEPRRGGVLVASLPAVTPDTARVMELIGDVWPQAAATDTVWTTVLTSYDAIEAAAADVIDAADAELLALRQALFSRESRGYHDFRAAQGLTPDSTPPTPGPPATPGAHDPGDAGDDAHGPTPGSTPPTPGPPHQPPQRDVPGALVLASSLGLAAGVPTPAIDALVSGAPAEGLDRDLRDLRTKAPTLAALGLGGLDVTGLIGFARSGLFP